MSLADCLTLVQEHHLNAVCLDGDATTSPLHLIERITTIAASLALVAAAIFGWGQLRSIKQQIKDARDGLLQQVKVARDNHRLTATLDLLIHIQTNSHWLEKRQKFIELRDSKEGLKKHARMNTDDAQAIRAMLNQYELIAIGIAGGILDEEMYRRYHRGTFVKDWLAAISFVNDERQENARYWIDMQQLAEKFQASG
ncbi:MAG TPA: DUF4760 domain-containing protein [Pseudolabrys sp.]|nr:DUF4760 domain-containing protein [Pseudolabrys sp.]